MTRNIPYAKALEALIDPTDAVIGRDFGKQAKRAKVDYNPLTNNIESIDLEENDVVFPFDSPYTKEWENVIWHNIGIEMRRVFLDYIATPVVNGAYSFLAQALDVFTLNAFGFKKNYDDKKADIAGNTIAQLKQAYVDTQFHIPVIGVPPEEWVSPEGSIKKPSGIIIPPDVAKRHSKYGTAKSMGDYTRKMEGRLFRDSIADDYPRPRKVA